MIPSRYTEFYGDTMRWFIGVVKNIDDPLELGRVQVKIFGIHESSKEDIPDEDLPYAQVVMPISEGGVKGLGNTVGLQVKARVFGIFLDGKNSQDPLVLGSLPKIEEESNGAITDVTTSQLARGTNTLSKSNDSIIDETPYDSRYKAAYPNNAVHQTSSGHVIEVDNTSGYERIHIFHKSGTFIEMHSNGDVVTQHKNGFRTATGDDKLHVTGNLDFVVEGDCNFSVKGLMNLTSLDNINIFSNKQVDIEGTKIDLNLGGVSLSWNGDQAPDKESAGGSGETTDEEGNVITSKDGVNYPNADTARNSGINKALIERLKGLPGKCTRSTLGELSEKYESNGKAGIIGTEKFTDVAGGRTTKSYGFHQISSDRGVNGDKTSPMDNFFTFLSSNPDYNGTNNPNENFFADLSGVGGAAAAINNTQGFGDKWGTLSEGPGFQQAQKDFIRRSHYDLGVDELQKSTGIDLCDGTMSNGVQEAFFSTAIQHGPGSASRNNGAVGVFNKALARTGKWDPTTKKYSGTQQELIDAIYDERNKKLEDGTLAYFQRTDESRHASISNRLLREKADNQNLDQVEQAVVNQASWFNVESQDTTQTPLV